jgi:pantothenate kinase-related protein Tda10
MASGTQVRRPRLFLVNALTKQNKRCHKAGSRDLMVDIQDQMVLDNNNSTEVDNRGITGGTSDMFDNSNRADR